MDFLVGLTLCPCNAGFFVPADWLPRMERYNLMTPTPQPAQRGAVYLCPVAGAFFFNNS